MATLATDTLTLADWAKRQDPNGQVADIVELLSQTNEILADMQWREGNLPTGHRTTVRVGLPSVAWRLLNYGVPPSKSVTMQADDSCGMLEAFSEVDKDLAMLNGNTAAFRLSEARSFLEAMNLEMATTLFYGNTAVTPNKFLGLAPRYSLLSAGNGGNIIDAGGTDAADNASIWLVVWGDQTVHGIFPKGSLAGLQREDLGLETVQLSDGSRLRAYREHFQWKCGISVRDWRYVVRIANIDVSLLKAATAPNDNLIMTMIDAIGKLPAMGMGKPVFYMNRTAFTWLKKQALAKSGGVALVETAANQFQLNFFGIPVRLVDALLTTEARVV